jgi:hypothetical protein
MKDCLVTKLKSVVQNDNLDILDYAKVIVNGKGASDNFYTWYIDKTGTLVSKPVGAYLLGGKTFVNGKTKVEDGDSVQFAPNNVYELMIPKYKYMPITASTSDGITVMANLACNINDYSYFTFSGDQPSDSWLRNIRFQPTTDNEKSSGSIEKHLDWANTDIIVFVDISDSNIVLDLSTTSLYKFYKATKIRFDNNKNVRGSLLDFINKFSLENAAQLKARTNDLIFYVWGMGDAFDFGPLRVAGTQSVRMHFTGASAITITLNNSSLSVQKTFNYDIDTQTLTEA